MYYQEKKTIASIISGLLVLAAYGIYVLKVHQKGLIDLNNDLKFWAITMLIFIGVGVVSTIVIQIVFHIINAIIGEIKQEEQDDPNVEDEMDKLISLKAMRNAYIFIGFGFVIAIITLVMQKPPAIMLNIIYLSYFIGSLFEGFSQLYFYRRGVHNG